MWKQSQQCFSPKITLHTSTIKLEFNLKTNPNPFNLIFLVIAVSTHDNTSLIQNICSHALYASSITIKFGTELVHIIINGLANFHTRNPSGGQATVEAVCLAGIYD